MAVNGDLKNIKKDIIAQLDMLYDYAVPSGQIYSTDNSSGISIRISRRQEELSLSMVMQSFLI